MKWFYSVLPVVVIAGTVCGQSTPSPSTASTQPAPITVIPEATTAPAVSGPLFGFAPQAPAAGTSAVPFSNFIGFMSNPVQNIDPRAINELYPIFANGWTSTSGLLPSADAQVYGVGLTVALGDRFAFGFNQGGYTNVQLSKSDYARLAALDPTGRFKDVELGGDRSGWINLGGFFQYTAIADGEDQLLVTGGLRWVAPCGSYEIFQGHGPAQLAPYATIGKAFGCYHFLGTGGFQFAAGPGSDTANFFYFNGHIDRECFGWLYPLFEVNSVWHTSSVDISLPDRSGFFDLDNWSSSGDIVTISVGANAVLIRDKLELGAVYTTSVYTQHDFNVNGLLVKLVYRF